MNKSEDNAWVDIHLARWQHFRGEGLIPIGIAICCPRIIVAMSRVAGTLRPTRGMKPNLSNAEIVSPSGISAAACVTSFQDASYLATHGR